MDPLTIVMSALQLADNDMVKDAYAGFKALIVGKFGANNPALPSNIDEYSVDPQGYHAPVKKGLTASGAATDPEVLAAAKAMLEQADAQKPGTSQALVNSIQAYDNSMVNVAARDINIGADPRTQPRQA